MAWVWTQIAGVSVADLGRVASVCGVGFDAGACAAEARSSPWSVAVFANLILGTLVWVSSVLRRGDDGSPDPSIVDKFWSITPFVNCWLCHWSTVGPARPHGSVRTLLVALLTTSWGIRLTWNFWRKGGYDNHVEDYRWVEVRKWMPGWQFDIFNLIFICIYQPLLLMALAAPAAVSAANPDAPLNAVDVAAAALFSALLCVETVADIQMFDFQTEKWRRKKAGESAGPYARGFIEHGMWSYSRHPNYFAEVHLWYAVYLFSVSASGEWLNWSVLGAVLLNLLFVPRGASCDVTEALSSRKYEHYVEYQVRVPRFYPAPW